MKPILLINRGSVVHYRCIEHPVNWNYQVSVVYDGISPVSRIRWTIQEYVWNE